MQYINGEWREGEGAVFESENPATGESLWAGKAANEAQVNAAVTVAQAAFSSWSQTSFEGRLALCEAFKARLEANKAELAEAIAKETGKAIWDATGEAAATIGKLAASKAAYEERTPTKVQDLNGFSAVLRHRPHGVMAVFGPYNFPSHLPNGHIIPALLAGNTIVYKPSELTPMVAEWYVKQWEAVGLPKGVLNLVQGERETGIALARAEINGLLFTGSSATGKILHEQLAGRPEVLLALELGGNNPLIYDNPANTQAAVYETIQSAFIGAGQRCTCARRLMVIEGERSEAFLEQLVEASAQLKVGPYTEETFMGPVISNKEADRLLAAQRMLVEKGGKVLLEMKRLQEGKPFVSPAIIDVTDCIDLPDEEYFGPLLKVHRVANMDKAIAEANNTSFGLSAALFSDDRAQFERFVQEVHAGLVNWNRQTTGASGMAPFGGVGCSGNHHPAGYYAADYCAFPTASMEVKLLELPEKLSPGVSL